VIISRRLRWSGLVTRVGRNHLIDLGVDGRIILTWIAKNNGRAWTGLIVPRIGGNGRLF
jgi:hypothetical protein